MLWFCVVKGFWEKSSSAPVLPTLLVQFRSRWKLLRFEDPLATVKVTDFRHVTPHSRNPAEGYVRNELPLHTEDGGSGFLRNISELLPVTPRRQWYSSLKVIQLKREPTLPKNVNHEREVEFNLNFEIEIDVKPCVENIEGNTLLCRIGGVSEHYGIIPNLLCTGLKFQP